MGIIAWIVLGLIAGFIASKIFVGSGQGLLLDIVLGIVGAVVGGYLFTALGSTGITGFNIWSMIVAIIGAIIVLWLYHMITPAVNPDEEVGAHGAHLLPFKPENEFAFGEQPDGDGGSTVAAISRVSGAHPIARRNRYRRGRAASRPAWR